MLCVFVELVIVPLMIDHAYVIPVPLASVLAVFPVELGLTPDGVGLIVNVGFAFTMTVFAADAGLEQPLMVTTTV